MTCCGQRRTYGGEGDWERSPPNALEKPFFHSSIGDFDMFGIIDNFFFVVVICSRGPCIAPIERVLVVSPCLLINYVSYPSQRSFFWLSLFGPSTYLEVLLSLFQNDIVSERDAPVRGSTRPQNRIIITSLVAGMCPLPEFREFRRAKTTHTVCRPRFTWHIRRRRTACYHARDERTTRPSQTLCTGHCRTRLKAVRVRVSVFSPPPARPCACVRLCKLIAYRVRACVQADCAPCACARVCVCACVCMRDACAPCALTYLPGSRYVRVRGHFVGTFTSTNV